MLVTQGPINQAPGVCFICEQAKDGTYVNTTYVFDPNGPTPLNGKKFICEGCVVAAAEALGFAAPKVVERIKAETKKAKDELQFIKAELGHLLTPA